MASDEFLARIDEHMARGNELMARGNELMDGIRAEFRLNRAQYRRSEIAFGAQSRALDDLIQMIGGMNETVAEGAQAVAGLTDITREMTQDLRQLGEEVRAQTQAIFRMLDRFDGGAQPGTA